MPTARLAVIGAGWAGLAAAVRACQAGFGVTVMEMAAQPGGRARSMTMSGRSFDNGQHILIGAYRRCLDLMHTVGVDLDAALLRMPLILEFPDGRGLRLRPGPPPLALLRAIAGVRGWGWPDRLALLRQAVGWRLGGFRCPREQSVDELCAALPAAVRADLIDPLCVAALNTPAARASGEVFLRVLRDALLGGPGSADLLLPRLPLSSLLADRAAAWLVEHGAALRCARRVQAIDRSPGGWRVDGEAFDAVLLACTAAEAARLAEPHAPQWAATARTIEHEAIVTVTLLSAGARLPAPMIALHEGPEAPAQFVFDRGALGLEEGVFAAVASGAGRWLTQPLDDVGELVRRQLAQAFPNGVWRSAPVVLKTLAEKRATFACTPGLARPGSTVAERLFAAGDYVEGPYPATLEGAVRSADVALSLCKAAFRHAESRA